MKAGIVVLFVLGLVGLSGWLFQDNFKLRKQLEALKQQEKAGEETDQNSSNAPAATPITGDARMVSKQLALANEEIKDLKNQLAFPIRATIVKKKTSGYTVEVFNKSSQDRQVTIVYSNAALKKTKKFEIQLMPGFSRDIGHMDGWDAAEGDTLQLQCPGFMPVTRPVKPTL